MVEILNRAKGKSDGEVVSCFESPKNVKEEADRRVRKAGYLSKRNTNMIAPPTKRYEENYVRIFGHD